MPSVSGGRQWRSIAELEGDPAFLERVGAEFPQLREALKSPQDRRQMLRLMGAAIAAAGLAGCYSGQPSGHLIPAVRAPADIIPGLPNHYATAHVLGGYALGTVVTQQNGRPIKVDGNPNHPSSLGGSSPFAQAEVLNFYDPDRAATVMRAGNPTSRQAMLGSIVSVQAAAAANHGKGLRILTGATTSPTLVRLMHDLLSHYGEAQWHVWEPGGQTEAVAGSRLAYGQPLELVARLDKADVILGFDSDLIGYGPGWVRYARDFASRRNPARTQEMSRVYAAEPSPTLLGSVADHRFIADPQQILVAITAMADILLGGGTGAGGPAWVAPVAEDLASRHGAAFVHAGASLPREAHALVLAMNEKLGGRGKTYDLIDPVPAQAASLESLIDDMRRGKVSALVIIDCNPAFTAPASLGFAEALAHVPLSFALSKFPDEIAAVAGWFAPLAHDWETWSDARGHDGTAVIMQPMALPLYSGLSPFEILIRLMGEIPAKPREIVQATWRGQAGSDQKAFDGFWHDTLANGVVKNSAAQPASAKLRPPPPMPPIRSSAHGIEIVFRPDPRIWDGRYANNPWLQELPAPLTKLTWDNPLLISPELARRNGLKNGDKVNLATDTGAMAIPVWIQPGQAANVVLAWYGNGRRLTGAVGTGAGFDVYPLMGGSGAAQIAPFQGHEDLASTDHHAPLLTDADTIVRHGTLAEFRKNPTFAKGEEKPELYLRPPGSKTAWGMSVDLNACIGCNACVIACQAENNVPTVGKNQVLVEREMQWLRIDRYYEGTIDEPESYFQPMFCQMCEEAPCETVCPPGATVHDSEGLNVMVYNRCIGTRFCSNNCPYKVRRFNFFAYSADQNRPVVSWNNNVSVRSGGVMEKCTYCVQRIWSARIIAAQTGVADGTLEVRTACQNACPTNAFSFGDQNNKETEVYQRKQSPLDYQLLEELHTHPRTTYEALVRNPNPALRKIGA